MISEAIGKFIAIVWKCVNICTLQQLQVQNGEHKSFDESEECFSWLETNSAFVFLALFTSISAQGIHESTKKMIDNMVFVSFTAVKVAIFIFIVNNYFQ
jgi:hypothetical protein